MFSLLWFFFFFFFFSSRRRHTRSKRDWSSDVCSSDLYIILGLKKSYQYCILSCISNHLFVVFFLDLNFTPLNVCVSPVCSSLNLPEPIGVGGFVFVFAVTQSPLSNQSLIAGNFSMS